MFIIYVSRLKNTGFNTEVSTVIKNSKFGIKFASLTIAYCVGSVIDIYTKMCPMFV